MRKGGRILSLSLAAVLVLAGLASRHQARDEGSLADQGETDWQSGKIIGWSVEEVRMYQGSGARQRVYELQAGDKVYRFRTRRDPKLISGEIVDFRLVKNEKKIRIRPRNGKEQEHSLVGISLREESSPQGHKEE